jgi:hypothetical protein
MAARHTNEAIRMDPRNRSGQRMVDLLQAEPRRNAAKAFRKTLRNAVKAFRQTACRREGNDERTRNAAKAFR